MNWWSRPSEWKRALPTPAAPVLARQSVHRYFAFLSYSHSDEAIARWLHEAIEQFRVPEPLVGRVNVEGIIPPRLAPIFRDRHELVPADDLGAEIRHALAASRFLIVLCSPAAARSKWTNAEVDGFKRSRPDGCVIAVILDGEPFASELEGREHEECFPPALRQRYSKRGRPTGNRAEPLAADLRQDRDGTRLGLLKIVARMLGVGLDDLVQRDHLRRQRRLGWITAGSLAGMLITSGLAISAVSARDDARDQRREAESLVGFMLGDLKEKLEPLARLDVLDAVGARALEYYQKQDKRALSDEALAQRSKALTLIGEIANTRGDLASALSRYREALAGTAEAVGRAPDDPLRLFDHAQNIFWIGYIAYQRGNSDEAARRFGEYKQLADRMVAIAPGENKYRLEQVYAESNLGTVLLEGRKFAAAVQAFKGSLRAAERIAAADPLNLEYQKQLSEMLGWLADAHEKNGEFERALAVRERQLQLLADLDGKHPHDANLQRAEMAAHRALGRLLAARGDTTRALVEAQAAVSISDALFAIEPDNTEWLQANVAGRFDQADLQLSLNRKDKAATTVRAGCEIADRLLQRDRSVAEWAGPIRTRCHILKSRLSLQQGAPAEAQQNAREALAAAEHSAKLIDRGVLKSQALWAGSSALQAAKHETAARRWAQLALEAAPPSPMQTPRELAQMAAVELSVGNNVEAAQIAARLDRLGYRHPEYLQLKKRMPH